MSLKVALLASAKFPVFLRVGRRSLGLVDSASCLFCREK